MDDEKKDISISDEEIKESTAVLKFRERWKLERTQKIKKWVLAFFLLCGFVIGMYFIFLSMGIDILDVFRSADNQQTQFVMGEGGLVLLGFIFILLFILESLTLGFIPGTTTLFITVIAPHIFQDPYTGEARLWITFTVVVVGIILSSIALYAFGRFVGRRILFWLFSKKELEHKLDWVARNGSKGVPWLFFIPFFPTDLLCIACGAAKMKFWQYMLIVLVFRPIEVLLLLSYTVIFPFILEQDFIIQVLVVNLVIINVFLLVIYHKALLNLFNRGINTFNFRKKYDDALAAAIAEEKARIEGERSSKDGVLQPNEIPSDPPVAPVKGGAEKITRNTSDG